MSAFFYYLPGTFCHQPSYYAWSLLAYADMKEAARISVIGDAKKRYPEKGLNIAKNGCKGVHEENEGTDESDINPDNFRELHSTALECTQPENIKMGRAGFGLNSPKFTQTTKEKEVKDFMPDNSNWKEVQDPVHNSHFSPTLNQVIEKWASLPNHIQQTIITLIETLDRKPNK